MADMKIENIVASTTIADELDLTMLSKLLSGGDYKPKRFPGLVLRLDEPKTAALLFRSGKVVCTGAKTTGDVKRAIKKVCNKVEKAGSKVFKSPEINIQNIVASANLNAKLNLNDVALAIGLEKVEYEPE